MWAHFEFRFLFGPNAHSRFKMKIRRIHWTRTHLITFKLLPSLWAILKISSWGECFRGLICLSWTFIYYKLYQSSSASSFHHTCNKALSSASNSYWFYLSRVSTVFTNLGTSVIIASLISAREKLPELAFYCTLVFSLSAHPLEHLKWGSFFSCFPFSTIMEIGISSSYISPESTIYKSQVSIFWFISVYLCFFPSLRPLGFKCVFHYLTSVRSTVKYKLRNSGPNKSLC